MTTTVGNGAEIHVVHARAAGLDVRKMQLSVSVGLCQPCGVRWATRQFRAGRGHGRAPEAPL